MLKMEGDDAPEGVAVRRDQRKVTVSTVEEAGVLPLAAVKAVTCTARVWPKWRAVVFVALAKVPKLLANCEATGRPLESIKKGFGLLARFTVRRSPILRLPTKEFCAAGRMSAVTISNWVELFGLMKTTVPSTVSFGVARSGSISWIVRVPSELRIASMLAAWLLETQVETCP